MTLKVEDIKVGDVVRIDVRVVGIAGDVVRLSPHESATEAFYLTSLGLANRNAEKVARARPVRRTEPIRDRNGGQTLYFVAFYCNRVVTWVNGSIGPLMRPEETVHADGSPIDWEASE